MSVIRINPLGDGGPPHAEVALLPDRAVWWPAARTLMVADLHLGKCEAMRARGAPMTRAALATDLVRLAAVIRRTEVARVIVLGDLLHAAAGVTPVLIDAVGEWRGAMIAEVELVVVPGNHDRRIRAVAEPWRLIVKGNEFHEGPFAFRHDPDGGAAPGGAYLWAGHIHPHAAIGGARDSLRLPCFWIGDRVGVLPAFGGFTGGVCVPRRAGERLFAVADGHVVAV